MWRASPRRSRDQAQQIRAAARRWHNLVCTCSRMTLAAWHHPGRWPRSRPARCCRSRNAPHVLGKQRTAGSLLDRRGLALRQRRTCARHHAGDAWRRGVEGDAIASGRQRATASLDRSRWSGSEAAPRPCCWRRSVFLKLPKLRSSRCLRNAEIDGVPPEELRPLGKRAAKSETVPTPPENIRRNLAPPERRATSAICLDDGCRGPLQSSSERLRQRDGAAHRRGDRQAVARDRSYARSRSEGRFANAIASRDTLSGIVLAWPIDGAGERQVELSGLPIFSRDRTFRRLSRLRRVPRGRSRRSRHRTRRPHSPWKQRLLRPHQQSREGAGASDAHGRAGGEERAAVSAPPRRSALPFHRSSAPPLRRSARP